jgi:hypothetical protein
VETDFQRADKEWLMDFFDLCPQRMPIRIPSQIFTDEYQYEERDL